MDAYAVIETGGKQYRVTKGELLQVERLSQDVGETVVLDKVMALSDGSSLACGNPQLEGASVTAEVMEHFRGKKVVAFKKKRRQGYKRKIGHRQEQTRIKIVDFAG